MISILFFCCHLKLSKVNVSSSTFSTGCIAFRPFWRYITDTDQDVGGYDAHGGEYAVSANGNNCIAATRASEDGYFYITVPGDRSVTERLTIIAVIDGNIVEASTSLYFGEDIVLGDYDNPFAITVGETTDIDKMLAEGEYVRMQVVSMNGRILYTGSTANFNENTLNDGQYIFEFFNKEGQAVCYKRLIKRSAE